MTVAREPALELTSSSSNETKRLGNILGGLVTPGDLILLAGGIGAGKTTFVQGLADGLGVDSAVQSPTFTLIMEHLFHRPGCKPGRLYHIDLYRIAVTNNELQTIGLTEYLDDPEAVVAIEWPERGSSLLPAEFLLVHLSVKSESERHLQFLPSGCRYRLISERMQREIASSD